MNFEMITKFAGIESIQDLLNKEAEFQREPARNEDAALERRRKMEWAQQQQEKAKDFATNNKQKQTFNTDHTLDAQREQARVREMNLLNQEEDRNRAQRGNSFQNEPAFASTDDLLKLVDITYDTDGQGGMDLIKEDTDNEMRNNPEANITAQEVMGIANRYRDMENTDESIISILEEAASKIYDINYNKAYNQRAEL